MSGRGAGRPVARDTRRVTSVLAAWSSHGTPLAPLPVVVTTAPKVAPRGCRARSRRAAPTARKTAASRAPAAVAAAGNAPPVLGEADRAASMACPSHSDEPQTTTPGQ